MAKIFISYRRNDTGAYADRIVERLNAFQFESVFQDREDIALGDTFSDEIRSAIAECAVVLVLIGPAWLDAADARGHRRLDQPTDWVRREIELAIAMNKRIIPVFFDAAVSLEGSDLPAVARSLRGLQGYPINGNYFNRDADELCRKLDQLSAPTGTAGTQVSRVLLHLLLIVGLLFVATVASAIAPVRYPALPATFWVLPGCMLFTAFAFLLFCFARDTQRLR